MASSRATLKAFFETGDIPTESEFAELIDSLASLIDTNFFESENTHAADILLEDGKSIRSKNFGGTLNLSAGLDKGVELTTDGGNFEEGWLFEQATIASIGFGSTASDTLAALVCKDKSIQFDINGPGATRIQPIKATNNAAGNLLKMAFFNQSEVIRPTVAGSRAGNAALASLLTALDSLGLIIDNTTA